MSLSRSKGAGCQPRQDSFEERRISATFCRLESLIRPSAASLWLGTSSAVPPRPASVPPLVIQGDVAFAGQGVIAECFGLSDLPSSGYRQVSMRQAGAI